MRPLLPEAIGVTWRDPNTVQLGLDPARAVLVRGVDAAFVDWLRSLDGTRSTEGAAAAAEGLSAEIATAVLTQLIDARVVIDGTRRTPIPLGVHTPRELLAPVLESCALDRRDPGAVLTARRGQCVVVRGDGRLAVPLASLLAAAGIGRVHVAARGVVTARDVATGGFSTDDVDRPRMLAAADAIRRCSPATDTRPPSSRRPPDLVVLTDLAALDPDIAAPLHAAGIAHLPCWIRERTAILGPLVRPGATSCLRCVDLHRTDRDPAWPAVSSQIVGRDRLPGGDPALTSTLAGLTAIAAIAHLDGADPEVLHGSIELTAGRVRTERRTWPVHPLCRCNASGLPVAG